ncbi:MAG: hypothetical protein GF375_04645 [Candidatus Omnitrophica bacterium]|nr:hypothetical protein [Candidatus Omnitrophota bacterium]MBD3269316.1 hypothetical protein [Candidatus Omnitrophota bacterium]
MKILLPVNKNIFSPAVLVSYTALILVASLIPLNLPQKDYFFSPDKLLHVFFYILLAFLATNLFFCKAKSYPGLKGFLYSFCLGLLIEGIQYFLPYRSFEAYDLLANLLGSLAGSRLKVV